MLEFCPICRELLMIKEENDKTFLYCGCGFKRFNFNFESIDQNKNKINESGIIKENIVEGNLHICRKCGFDKAEIIDLGERATDESGVYLFKCQKCGNTER